jgi:hypothetical protein
MRFFLLLALYLALAAAWAWRLKPEAPAAQDPQRTVKLERLTHYLAKSPAVVVKSILMSIMNISDERLALVDEWLQRPSMEQLRDLTIRDAPMLRSAGNLRDSLLLGWLGQEKAGLATHEAHLMIAAAGDRLDDQMRLYAFETLASRARSEGDADTAMTILDRAADLPRARWSITRSYVQLARERDTPSAALAAVTDWLKKAGENPSAADLEEARELQNHFLLRVNLPEKALDIQLQRLKAIPAEALLPESTLNRALISARAAGQQLQVLPWLERMLDSFSDHALSPEALLTHPDLDSSYLHWLHEYATLADRELPAVRGYETYLRLAATGERSALARLCALAGPAKRSDEAVRFLQRVLAQPALRPTLLTLAQQDALARRTVAEALRNAPADRDLHYAATLAEAAASPGSATSHWQSYLRRFPQDVPAQRRLIQAHLTARQPDLALRVFDSIPPEALNEADHRQRELLSQL